MYFIYEKILVSVKVESGQYGPPLIPNICFYRISAALVHLFDALSRAEMKRRMMSQVCWFLVRRNTVWLSELKFHLRENIEGEIVVMF